MEPYGYQQENVVKLEMEMLVVAAQIEYWGLPCNESLLLAFENAIEDGYGGGEMYRVAEQVLEQFGYVGEDHPYYDYRIPYPQQLQRLNNPESLRCLIETAIAKKAETDCAIELTDAQRSSLQRLADVLSAYSAIESGNAARIMYIDEEEESRYAFIAELSADSLRETSTLVNQILEYKKYAKQAGMQLSKYVHPITGCIHSSFRQAYAATGRSASSNPNSQNINGRLTLELSISAETFLESSVLF